METEPISLLATISGFAYVIPVIVGVVYWKFLTKPLKIYWLWHVVGIVYVILGWLSVILGWLSHNQDMYFHLSRALTGVGMGIITGWFCVELFQKRSEKIAIGIIYAAFISYDLYDWLRYGSRIHYNQMTIAQYGLVAVSTFVLLRKLFTQEHGRLQKPIFVALLTLFFEHFLGVLFSGITEPLLHPFSSYWLSFIWYEVVPATNLIFVGMATYALYLGGQAQRNLGEIPELEAVE